MASDTPIDSNLPSEEEIAKLSREAQVVYAVRAAIRVYPLIGSEGDFDFWKDAAPQHSRAVMAAALVAMLNLPYARAKAAKAAYAARAAAANAANARAAAANARAAAANAANARAAAAAYAAAAAAARAAKAAYARAARAANAAYAAAAGAADAAYAAAAGAADAKTDYQWLITAKEPRELYQQPLFFNTQDFYTEELLKTCQSAFESIKQGSLFDLWMRFYEGKAPKDELLQIWVEEWNKGNLEYVIPGLESSETGAKQVSAVYCHTAADRPAEKDLLGRDTLVASLREMLSRKDQPTPLTLALFGHWGAGKSSVMHLLQKELAGQKNQQHVPFLFSWFNCWEYEHTECIRSGLAQEVVRGLLSNGKCYDDDQRPVRDVWWLRKEWIRFRYLVTAKWKELLGLLGYGAILVLVALLGLLPYGIQLFKGHEWVQFLLERLNIEGLGVSLPFLKALGAGVVGLSLFKSWDLLKKFYQFIHHPLTVRLATFYKLPSYQKQLGQIPEMRQQLLSLSRIRLYSIWGWWRSVGNQCLNACRKIPAGMNRLCLGRKPFKEFQPKKWRPVPSKRLLVFVDDLDRCNRDKIAEVFDAIRLITHIEGVVVMVAIDERIAFKAMGHAYKDFADAARTCEDVARDYLGKIIQVPITLQKPEPGSLDDYMEKALFPESMRKQDEPEESGPGKDEGNGGQNPKRGDSVRTAESGDSSGQEIEEMASVAVDQQPVRSDEKKPTPVADYEAQKWSNQEVQEFKDLVNLFGFHNPRQLLRLNNSYRLLRTLMDAGEGQEFGIQNEQYSKCYAVLLMLFCVEASMDPPMEGLFKTKGNGQCDAEEFLESILNEKVQSFFKEAEKNGLDLSALRAFTHNYVLPDLKPDRYTQETNTEFVEGL